MPRLAADLISCPSAPSVPLPLLPSLPPLPLLPPLALCLAMTSPRGALLPFGRGVIRFAGDRRAARARGPRLDPGLCPGRRRLWPLGHGAGHGRWRRHHQVGAGFGGLIYQIPNLGAGAGRQKLKSGSRAQDVGLREGAGVARGGGGGRCRRARGAGRAPRGG